VSFFSCSDKLTNGKAEQLVKEGISFPKIEDEPIRYGLVSYDRDSLPKYYYILQQKGMFNIEYLGKGGSLFFTSYRFRVTPTEEAKKYFTHEDRNPIKQGNTGEYIYTSRFKTCEVGFDRIESVQEIPALNSADITYTVKRSNFTPFWSYYLDKSNRMPDTVQKRPYGAIKTNDGWKPAK
jgi:hypothetical protein